MKADTKLNLVAKPCVDAANAGCTHEFLLSVALLAFEQDGFSAWLGQSENGGPFSDVRFQGPDFSGPLCQIKIRKQKQNGFLKCTLIVDGKTTATVELPGINWASREGIEEAIEALSAFMTEHAHVSTFGVDFVHQVFTNWNEMCADVEKRLNQRDDAEEMQPVIEENTPAEGAIVEEEASDATPKQFKAAKKRKARRKQAKAATSTHERTGETKEVDPVCAWIKERRKALGLTQVQLSELTGVKQPVIARNERGAVPTIPILRQLTAALGPYTLG